MKPEIEIITEHTKKQLKVNEFVLTASDNDFKTIKSAEIDCKKNISYWQNESRFNEMKWQIVPAPCAVNRFSWRALLTHRVCVECGREMDESEHNYGTDETAGNIQVCLQCYDLAQQENNSFVEPNGMPTLKGATAMFNAIEKSN